MADKEFLGDRRRSQEEEYFQRREQELIARLQQRSQEQAARRNLAERTGVVDEEVLSDLEALGYTPDTVMLLHLAPLLQVAWAEGGVSERERGLILEAARARGVEPGSPADAQLASWITSRPSADFFDRTLRVIRAILQGQPPEEREANERDVLSYSTAIASASGGILGFGKVSAEEVMILQRIGDELALARQTSHAAGSVRNDPE
ncbi:MAG TPA: hypothetical protein VGJ60_13495 [Chloroflexota bacterium]|jgi:ADP-ribose pyrophosphatase YjhB (NUDIX family)